MSDIYADNLYLSKWQKVNKPGTRICSCKIWFPKAYFLLQEKMKFILCILVMNYALSIDQIFSDEPKVCFKQIACRIVICKLFIMWCKNCGHRLFQIRNIPDPYDNKFPDIALMMGGLFGLLCLFSFIEDRVCRKWFTNLTCKYAAIFGHFLDKKI